MTDQVRNARAEATARLGAGFEARVLEPSPPASTDPGWFADDPTARGSGASGVTIVSPISTGDVTWDAHVAGDPELSAWAADRWLGAWRRLAPLPDGFAGAREEFHRLAFYVLSAARERATGKIALRYTMDGFGTPFFGADRQIRVAGIDLIVQEGAHATARPITTLEAAAALAGIDYEPRRAGEFDVPAGGAGTRPLEVSAAVAAALADWFGFAFGVLEELRAAGSAHEPGRVQLWAEHFDPAVELGAEARGQRASYGASPGDLNHPEPYLYVAPWGDPDGADPFWNASGFGGAALGYRDLIAAADQRAAALAFYRSGLERLTG